jgi:hypothetical protein
LHVFHKQSSCYAHINNIITPATIYIKAIIPAKAGIQNWLGCRIKSGMTVYMFNCHSNNLRLQLQDPVPEKTLPFFPTTQNLCKQQYLMRQSRDSKVTGLWLDLQ